MILTWLVEVISEPNPAVVVTNEHIGGLPQSERVDHQRRLQIG